MWTFDDASRLGDPDMDSRRACPSYGAGFDACDPLGSFLEWTGGEPARILRRRCRSEGLDRPSYEDASREGNRYHPREQPNKSQFTLNSEPLCNRFLHECVLPPAAENGDYIMSHEPESYQGYPSSRSKYHRQSPTRSLLVTTLSNTKVDDTRLPKVEELLERVDHEMMDLPHVKQPLKSILNNPLPSSPLHGILKKPKNRSYQDNKGNIEGRRRQRASSESDNLYGSLHMGSPVPGIDSRISSYMSNTKRAKDSSGIGYSYGSAIASLPVGLTAAQKNTIKSQMKMTSNLSKQSRCSCKDQVIVVKNEQDMRLLRTSAINSETVNFDTMMELPRQETPTPTCPAVSPALPVSSVTTSPGPKKTKIKKKIKGKTKASKMKISSKTECSVYEDTEDGRSRDSSPDQAVRRGIKHNVSQPILEKPPEICQMDTDILPPLTVQQLDKVIEEKTENLEKTISKINGSVAPVKTTPRELEGSPPLPDFIINSLRPSLFSRVPPYIKFYGHDDIASMAKLPLPIQKQLKWKLTTITPIVVKKVLINSGFRLVKSECETSECPQDETVEWIGIWGKHMKSVMFRALREGQKMNHFPGTFQIGRKDRLWRNLQKLVAKFGLAEFGIMPKTYVLPHDLKLLKHDWDKCAANDERWIIKPPASARGTGIKVVSRWTQIPKKRPVVVQKYIAKPYLINGNKFDLRLYVLVTSIHPMRIYLYKDGLARFASVKYNDEVESLNDRYMHLTNYSINRLSKNYTPNEDFSACEGHKWTLQTLLHYLKTEKLVDTEALWDSMKDLVIKTIISGEASISSLSKANIVSRYNCYELFGIDVLLDEQLKPWLLEVNISPSLHSASPLDIHVKGPLVTTVLNIAQFQVPTKTNLDMLTKEKPHKLGGLPFDNRLYTVYLSKEERDKHIIYTNMEEREIYLRDILSTLTSDDVRHLIQAEDELTQSADMERIFPTHSTHKYLAFLAGPRYYNRLFDAWETRYGKNRAPGIELLRNLCDIGYHLEEPTVPLKNDVDAPTVPPSERPSVASVTSVEQSCSCGALGGLAPRLAGTGLGALAALCGDLLAPEPRA